MNNKHSEEYRQLGLNISYRRKMRGWTQLELAERVGISRTHLSNIEAMNVTTSISLETLLNIADALETPAHILLKFEK